MTKRSFLKHIIISSLLTIIAVSIIISVFIITSKRYSMPNEDNTSIMNYTIVEVYHGVPKNKVVINMASGESLQLVFPWRVKSLYSSIGYDITELAELLEGKTVECLRMNDLPWAVKIYVEDTVIDNSELTKNKIITSRIWGVILLVIILSFPIIGEISYLKDKYKHYKKAEKKRNRKLKKTIKSNEAVDIK